MFGAIVGSNADINKFITVILNANKVLNEFIVLADLWYSVKCSRQSLNKFNERLNTPDSTC